jgi:hypothetical protein
MRIPIPNVQSCLHSQKRIRNNSVYCQYQDRGWICVKNCEGCPHYELDTNVTPAAPEEIVDSTGPIHNDEEEKGIMRDEEGIVDDEEDIKDDIKEAEESLMRLGENEE